MPTLHVEAQDTVSGFPRRKISYHRVTNDLPGISQSSFPDTPSYFFPVGHYCSDERDLCLRITSSASLTRTRPSGTDMQRRTAPPTRWQSSSLNGTKHFLSRASAPCDRYLVKPLWAFFLAGCRRVKRSHFRTDCRAYKMVLLCF